MFIIIGYVYQLIGNCPIPLDPWDIPLFNAVGVLQNLRSFVIFTKEKKDSFLKVILFKTNGSVPNFKEPCRSTVMEELLL